MEGDQCERESGEQEFGGFEGLGKMGLGVRCSNDGDERERGQGEGTTCGWEESIGIAPHGVTW